MRAECFSTEDYIWRMAIVIVIATFSQSFREMCSVVLSSISITSSIGIPGTRYPYRYRYYTRPGTGTGSSTW